MLIVEQNTVMNVIINSDSGLGNQVQALLALDLLKKEGYKVITNSDILNEMESFDHEENYDFVFIIYPSSFYKVISYDKPVIAFPYLCKRKNIKIGIDFCLDFDFEKTEVENNLCLISLFIMDRVKKKKTILILNRLLRFLLRKVIMLNGLKIKQLKS